MSKNHRHLKPSARLALAFALFCPTLPMHATDSSATPPRWHYETMKPADLAEAIRTRPVAWLVLSPLEWHGEAIAFCSDPLTGGTIAERAWEKAGGVLLPTLYIGAETEYKYWDEQGLHTRWGMELITKEHNPGSLYVRPMTLELVLRDYLAALQREGFKLAVVVTGHGGTEHVQVLREVCQRDWGDMKVVLWPGAHAGPELPASLRIKHEPDTGHADVFEASIVGGIDPSLVDRAAFGVSERDRKAGLLKENAGAIDFEKGRGIIDYNAAQLAAKVTELLGESKR
jgi:creatinine amidohydrolase